MPLKDDTTNDKNDNYKNYDNLRKASYLNNDSKINDKINYNFENADRNKWTWRPGTEMIEKKFYINILF